MASKKRQLNEDEKKEVVKRQTSSDGSLRCYISGEVLNLDVDDVEYDHLVAFADDGPTDIDNIRVFRKKFNKEKGKMPLGEYKEYYDLKRLYEQKQNKVKLQDIFAFKKIFTTSINASSTNGTATLTDGAKSKEFALIHDSKLDIDYFYGQLPINWIQNDDQQGLQPRVIDFKRLWQIKKHLEDFPQLAPSIARLLNNQIKLFDGQHKLAAQVLNGTEIVDVKVYISPQEEQKKNSVYEKLLKTNLEAHSKLAQVSFYTNTLFQKWNEIYDIKWEEYLEQNPSEKHSELGFFNYLSKREPKPDAKKMFEATIIKSVHDDSKLKPFTAESNKDQTLPLSQDLLFKTIFKHTLYLLPSNADVDSELDYRDSEKENFYIISDIIVEQGYIADWIANKRDTSLKHQKARRIWTKASVLTWAPFIKSMTNYVFQIFDDDLKEKQLYRKKMTDDQKETYRKLFNRLFNHPFWQQNDSTIDKQLGTAASVKDLFDKQGLTWDYISKR